MHFPTPLYQPKTCSASKKTQPVNHAVSVTLLVQSTRVFLSPPIRHHPCQAVWKMMIWMSRLIRLVHHLVTTTSYNKSNQPLRHMQQQVALVPNIVALASGIIPPPPPHQRHHPSMNQMQPCGKAKAATLM